MRPPDWMVWNLLLAAVPLGLSFWLFRLSRRRGVLWWSGLIAFIAFLPNAPYVASDLLHLAGYLRGAESWPRAIVLLAGFGGFVFAGMEAYALCIANVRHFLGRRVIPLELALHGLCAVGIYVGRVLRFNSWDLLDQALDVARSLPQALLRPRPATLVALTFVLTVAACEALLSLNATVARATTPRRGSN